VLSQARANEQGFYASASVDCPAAYCFLPTRSFVYLSLMKLVNIRLFQNEWTNWH